MNPIPQLNSDLHHCGRPHSYPQALTSTNSGVSPTPANEELNLRPKRLMAFTLVITAMTPSGPANHSDAIHRAARAR